MSNTKLLNDLYKRKLFKSHIYHESNIEEEYYWDDYDTTYGYKMNVEACCLPCKPVYITTRHTPKIKNHPINLHKGEKTKTLLTWNTHHNTKSTQTDNSNTCNETTQTFPQFYFSQRTRFPGPSSNFNFEPFNTDLIL